MGFPVGLGSGDGRESSPSPAREGCRNEQKEGNPGLLQGAHDSENTTKRSFSKPKPKQQQIKESTEIIAGDEATSDKQNDDEGADSHGGTGGQKTSLPSGEEDVEKGDEEKAKPQPWQAVWEPSRQAWYFWNSETNETTWDNPLTKSSPVSSSDTTKEKQEGIEAKSRKEEQSTTTMTDEEWALTNGIDPDLAYLDPSLYAAQIAQAQRAAGSSAGPAASYSATGSFDARSGRFVPATQAGHGGNFDPSRLSAASQADRQMGVFFDTQGWEEQKRKQREEEELDEELSKKRKPTKQELQMYKDKKKEKKAARYGWLKD